MYIYIYIYIYIQKILSLAEKEELYLNISDETTYYPFLKM